MSRIERLVPLIGATVAGPLGVVHLPRMWLKSVLSAAGMLYEGYVDYNKGFNQRVVDGLGLDPDTWFGFLATMPTYPQAEAYVKANATKLSPASIAAVNTEILTFLRPEETCATLRARVGLADSEFRNSARLLNFDDWFTFHQDLVAHRGEALEPIVPMVSSSQTGALDVPHLPRLWAKALLAAVKALPEGWKSGTNCGFDKRLAELIGLDLAVAWTLIQTDMPNYLQFERWVSEHIAKPDAATKAQWTATILGLLKTDEQANAELAEAGEPDLSLRGTILLNDLVDWKHMHDYATARRLARA
ncbi:MAG TPA: hypothetical protein VN603_09315 [Candidatus Acidoferrales bacterium]|nr:hypothetical protein [Candidatus Acidoferrales bacterium]